MQILTFNRLISTCLLLAGALLPHLGAEEVPDSRPFIGFWEFQEPAGDKAVVIIKLGGQLSCFWSGSHSRAIEKGTWTMRADGLLAEWESGHIDLFRKIGDNAMERKSFPPGSPATANPTLTLRGIRVDSRLPGSLTVNRSEERVPAPANRESEPDAIALRNPFLGYWKVPQSTGFMGVGGAADPYFYVRITRNGQTTLALRNWGGDNSWRGTWELDGDRLIVTWPDGHRDIIQPAKGGGYELLSYRPRDRNNERPNERRPAEMILAIDAERFFSAGEFKRLSVSDIRGRWEAAEKTGVLEYIDIHGWGNAFRFPSNSADSATDSGKWQLQSDRVIITWSDGSSDVLRIQFPRIIRDSYAPDRPITGKPERSVEVTRTAVN